MTGVGVELARRGDPTPGSPFDHPCYRIPALTVTASGRVLAAWDVRADWRDLPGPFDVVLRHSDDHGRTWSEPRFLRRHEGEAGFGDVSLTASASGRVLAWYVGSQGESFFSAEAGRPGLELWLAVSDDDGETWTHTEHTAELRPGGVAGMFAASGNGVQLRGEHAGRLLQPFVLRRPQADAAAPADGPEQHFARPAEHWAAVAASDDDGATWRLGPPIGPDCDESKAAQVPGGAVVLHVRARPRRRWCTSPDGLDFGAPRAHEQLLDPGCNGGLAAWGEMLVCSTLDDPAERRRLVLRTSRDRGASWSEPVLVDDGGAAYSVLAPLADGALGLLYEEGDYASLVFRRLEPAQLLGAAPLPVRHGGAAARPPVVRPVAQDATSDR